MASGEPGFEQGVLIPACQRQKLRTMSASNRLVEFIGGSGRAGRHCKGATPALPKLDLP